MKILIVAPYYPPYKSVGVLRISSLVSYIKKNTKNKIYILTNKLEDRKIITEEEIIEVDITNKGNGYKRFFLNAKEYRTEIEKILAEKKIDIVLITTGPFYTLPLCKIIKKRNAKCIVDFRDLWIFSYLKFEIEYLYKTILSRIIFFPVEFFSIKYSDMVITVTGGWKKRLSRIYFPFKEKIQVIYNGYNYDFELFKGEYPKYFLENDFKIVCFGKLSYYSIKYAELFFKAVKDLEINNKKVIQIGSKEKGINELLSKLDFPIDRFISTGFIDYYLGINYIKKSNVLILIDIRKEAIGTKIYDYILVNKPIIYIGKNDTMLSKFISSFSNGFSCSSVEEIKKVLLKIKSENLDVLDKNLNKNKYSREIQNKKYLKIIMELCDKNEN